MEPWTTTHTAFIHVCFSSLSGVFLTSPLVGTLSLALVTPLSIAYSVLVGQVGGTVCGPCQLNIWLVGECMNVTRLSYRRSYLYRSSIYTSHHREFALLTTESLLSDVLRWCSAHCHLLCGSDCSGPLWILGSTLGSLQEGFHCSQGLSVRKYNISEQKYNTLDNLSE